MNTRVVIQLVRDSKPFKGLTKEFIINAERVYLFTSQMGTVNLNELEKKVCSLSKNKEEIKNSIDFLMYGY